MTEFTDYDALTMDKKPQVDAGLVAREKLEAKRKSRKGLWLTLTAFILGVLIALGLAGHRVYQEYLKPGVRVTDYRECLYEDAERKIELTGKREYSYVQKEFFGIQYRDSKQVLEKTVINVRGNAMSITGLSEGSWQSVYVGEGEQGIQILMPADLYVISLGKKVAVFDYQSFCK